MKIIGFIISCLVSLHITFAFHGSLLKHLTEPKPGGILDIIKKPKLPGINIHLVRGGGGFGAGASIGSFGFGFGFGGQYHPPGSGGPPKDPKVPDWKPEIPEHIPDPRPHYPDQKPHYPDRKPHIPDSKPHIPGVPWEEEKERPRPNWEEYEEDDIKGGTYEAGNKKHDSFEESKKDTRPVWEDIGEKRYDDDDSDSKSERFMNGELVSEGLIQPRIPRRRNRRFVESHIYHVPLLFRSNAKPFQVTVKSNPNSLIKERLEK